MLALNGLGAAEQLKQFLPNGKFVFLTMKDEANLAAAALNLGKVGCVLKHSLPSELLHAASEVLHGNTYVRPRLRSGNWAVQESRTRQFWKDLTPR
jgi:DNA-binding NarL/FixJ family response regulator